MKLLLIREGDYKPNLFLDILSMSRDLSECEKRGSYSFFSTVEDKFTLSSSKDSLFSINIPTKDLEFLNEDQRKTAKYQWGAESLEILLEAFPKLDVFLLAAIIPKNLELVSSYQCLDNLGWIFLNENADFETLEGEVLDRSNVTIIPFLSGLRYGSSNVIGLALNSKLVSLHGNLPSTLGEWKVSDIFSNDSPSDTIVSKFFAPKLVLGNNKLCNSVIFQIEEFSKLIFPQHLEDLGILKDLWVDSNLEYSNKGGVIRFHLPKHKPFGYIKVWLPLSNRLDLDQLGESETPLINLLITHY